ncbi:helix-turn-helix transcriptional regulator [Mucilaginibacter sabulilitoris]|uniref:Helix-turn-helix transcriptional regulator n=1 Tax=Mucilaginibacter sabulilitoris TaxID=1173583 RepID=A0ABZ0TFB8_9SPHI|nr:helix-turn-helix transcriptional regulator [Mucilaginibacter sabulilitoris]WPU91875.1 helix-turn-helix transcriptional regulator [Mucilaginibacter sabulilitoris]
MNNRPNPTWLHYLHISKNKTSDLILEDPGPIETMIGNLSGNSFDLLAHNAPVVYLNDYRSNSYVFMSKTIKSLCGHDAEAFIRGGIGHAVSLFHKDDLRLFNEQIFPDRLKFLKSIPASEHKNYLFSYNFRIKTKAGHYISILQKNTFIQSDLRGNPLMSLGMIYDISAYADPAKTVHTIDKFSTDAPCSKIQTLEQTNYYLDDRYKQFSNREREVLLWMADGLTSKEIADKLSLSEHTVINHRRNMQEKTNTPNAISLVAYSIKKNLI